MGFSGFLDEVVALDGESVIPQDGRIVLSDAPGLGIGLNESAVAKLTVI